MNHQRRHGSILIATLTCILIASALTISSISALRIHVQHQPRQIKARQVELLIDAAIKRSQFRLKQSANYSGEQWLLPNGVTNIGDAIVEIKIDHSGSDNSVSSIFLRLTDPQTLTTVERTITIPNPEENPTAN